MQVRDGGKGSELKFLTAQGRSGHFGVLGRRERVGGKFTVGLRRIPAWRSGSGFRCGVRHE
jgi:hypothetical protein